MCSAYTGDKVVNGLYVIGKSVKLPYIAQYRLSQNTVQKKNSFLLEARLIGANKDFQKSGIYPYDFSGTKNICLPNLWRSQKRN